MNVEALRAEILRAYMCDHSDFARINRQGTTIVESDDLISITETQTAREYRIVFSKSKIRFHLYDDFTGHEVFSKPFRSKTENGIVSEFMEFLDQSRKMFVKADF